MKISEILSLSSILSSDECNSKKVAIELLAEKIADCDNGVSKIDVINCLVARERLGSTGIGNGIAIPHGRLKYCKKTIAAFIHLNNGVDFNCLNRLVLFFHF